MTSSPRRVPGAGAHGLRVRLGAARRRGRPRRSLRPAALTLAFATALTLTACAPALPNSVVSGSSAVMAWQGSLTSTNPASTTGATPGNLDVAALTRARFAERVGGADVVDERFGRVSIVDPESFTVRYDLAEPQWSDGIPIDAADLLLAWAAGSNFHAPEDLAPEGATPGGETPAPPEGSAWFDAVPSGLVRSAGVPEVDEFERRIDVRFHEPIVDWRTALDVAVPAHVVGQLAFDLSDPMEAKQAVSTAIRSGDGEAVARIATEWNAAFAIDSDDVDERLLLSSGPYRIDALDLRNPEAQRIELVVNNAYRGRPTPQFERLELRRLPGVSPLDALGDTADVVQLAPRTDNREAVRERERTDYRVTTTHDGTQWALVLRADRGEFTTPGPRTAFLRAVPRRDMVAAAAGPWQEAYPAHDSLLFPPESGGYQIALEDADLPAAFDRPAREAAEDRERARVPAGTSVCVLYDARSEFATGLFSALQAGAAEAGWDVRDCGDEDLARAVSERDDWSAVIARVPVPDAPADIAAQWGTWGAASLSGATDPERDALIEELARTADQYEARDLRVRIETSLVSQAIAVPLAMNPVVTVADRDIDAVRPRPGAVAPLTAGAVDWSPADG
ncbi:hypothetical protein [Microbacterium album]|uniref:Solute-binding protein family 5 domain-containing protein n=1 Tax=Microbacterium album TaxID=2053191 RepID=A0A917MLJ8_9MICO|nr:hypothetical protein [Microbacterium album]GGH42833.1 hypothetical protein GCM10010921_16310 [Microbacterium album]